jgi:hypothetical protein
MRFTPKSEKEIHEMGLWPAGEYGFEILDQTMFGGNAYFTDDKVSKSGNDMIQLIVKVYNQDGQFRIVIDYLLESLAFKLRHAAVACGLLDKYESGELKAADFVGKSGNLKLKVGKEQNGYPAKNEVADYIVHGIGDPQAPAGFVPPPKAPTAADGRPLDDEIPF